MKKLPRKTKQWAKEAYDSLCQGLTLFHEEFETPSEDDKFDLFRYCVAFAAMNRDILDKERVEKAQAEVYGTLMHEIDCLEPLEKLNYSISFLIAYLDAQVAFGFLTHQKIDDIMEHLVKNFDIPDEL